ncbi:sensor histidine kinase [Butyrivibrio sp. AE3004]|uniref:sensor histidine kinase n=1 Tax=Butyrivibrio sp. AE3004 TaxID=1506994 RepID=UPI000494658F|nr:histidine kinase [Butyrivibrio sp. AE3004]
MMRRGRVGRQMYRILLLTLIIPVVIIGIMAAIILVRQMNGRYEEQVKADNTRVKSIMFDVTSSLYTNLEPVVSVQTYRDMFSAEEFTDYEKDQYDSIINTIMSLRRSTAAVSTINIYTNNPKIPTGNYIINVGTSGYDEAGDVAGIAAGSGDVDDPFLRYEWYRKIDPNAWDSYTCTHVPLNEHENAFELTLVRRFNTGNSTNRAYVVATVSTNYLRNRLITTDNYMLAHVKGEPAFFSSEYDDKEKEMPETFAEGTSNYNYLGDMMLDGKLALTYVSSFAPYKVDTRFFVLVGDYTAHNAVRDILTGYILVLILAVAGPVIAIFLYSRYFTNRVYTLREAMHRASTGDYDIIESISGDDELSDTFNDLKLTTEQIRDNEAKYYQAKIREQELVNMQQNMEFKMLSGQINPHFLYNTLEAIRMQAIRGGDRDVATSVKYLAKIMHYVLESTGRATARLSDELKHVESYLQIQRLRFGEKVAWNFYISDDVDPEQYMVLPLLIQPIVENAISHGLKEMDKNGHISIVAEYESRNKKNDSNNEVENATQQSDNGDLKKKTEERQLIITINDDGKGMTEDEVRRLNKSLDEKRNEGDGKGTASIGLYNIHQRIKLHYGENYGVTIRSQEGKGTSVELRLPEKSDE